MIFEDGNEAPGFNLIKRELVILIGTMARSDRAIQDRLRACGGIEVVLNMCVVDERNPCERRCQKEKYHALTQRTGLESHAGACNIRAQAYIDRQPGKSSCSCRTQAYGNLGL